MEGTLADNPPLSRSILGTADPKDVNHRLDAFCKEHLRAGVEEILFFRLGTGAAFGLILGNGRRAFLKAHPPGRDADYLRAVHRVQTYLHRHGFPCPNPILGPLPFGAGLATVDELVDGGAIPDGHDPGVRCRMAQVLARQIELAAGVPDIRGLEKGWPWPGKDELWPPPHNALYDFEATREGAGWIDAVAAEAKAVVDNFKSRAVVGHTDWSADQIRVDNGEISAVYDWDSLRPEKEEVVVGIAAANFTSTWSTGVPNPPTPGETRLFAEEYEKARDRRFSEEGRKIVAAAGLYATAYLARCEHALDAEGEGFHGSFREALAISG